MRVAVVGGSGIAGAYAVEALRDDGHEAASLSRSSGVDVRTGHGLDDALAGVDVVINAVNTMTLRRSVATEFFTAAARQLQAAAERQDVQHIVTLSIIGIDQVRGYGYYEAKLAEEREISAGPVPATVLRASQFHEFPGQVIARMRIGPVAPVPHLRSQPVAARTVGRHLARLAAQRPGGTVEVAGPEVHDVVDLARRLVQRRGERVHVLALPAAGKVGRDVRRGGLLATPTTELDGPPYGEWLDSGDAVRLDLSRRSKPAAGTGVAGGTR